MERTVTVRTELESILVEQALAMARELEAVTDAAPDGQVLAVAEAGRRPARPRADPRRPGGGLAAAGRRRPRKRGSRPGLPLRRPPRHQGQGGQDDRDRRRPGDAASPLAALPRLRADGLPARRPDRPRRLPQPARHPAGLPGRGDLVVRRRLGPPGGVRRRADRRRDDPPPRPSGRRRRWRGRREAAPPQAAFAAAEGEVEFLTDGVMAPTRDGWRELKMAVYQKRPRGEPAEPDDWAERELPRPTAQRRLCDGRRLRGVLGAMGAAGRRRWGSTRPAR